MAMASRNLRRVTLTAGGSRQLGGLLARAFSAGGEYDLCVIGAGPGGYTGAIKAAQLGLKTAIIDKRDVPGGTCLNVGCIPSKALLHASALYHEAKATFESRGIEGSEHLKIDFNKMMANKNTAVKKLTGGIEGLFKRDKVDYVKGHGKLTGPNSVTVAMNDGTEKVITAKNIMLATGSEIIEKLPFVEVDEEQIVSSTGALELKTVPEKMVVIGGGVIGLELGSVYERLGSNVTVVEFLPTIGGLGIDAEVAKDFQRILKKQGISFKMKTKVTAVEKVGGMVKITMEPAAGGEPEVVEANVCLVCIGRREYRDNLGVEDIGIEMDGKKIKVDESFKTNVPGVFAIGDIINGPMLAHKAEDEGAMVAEYIATGVKPHLDYNNVPSVVYTHPEVAWVGKTEEQLKADGVEYKKGKFSFQANGRAIANGDTDGFVKVLACKKTDKLLGVHIIQAVAGEIIGPACVGIEYGAAAEDIARTCMAHPTVSEVLKGASQKAAFGKAISG
jgi:dihydrolipoamide dehydrogenase